MSSKHNVLLGERKVLRSFSDLWQTIELAYANIKNNLNAPKAQFTHEVNDLLKKGYLEATVNPPLEERVKSKKSVRPFEQWFRLTASGKAHLDRHSQKGAA